MGTTQVVEKKMASGQEVHWLREVVLLSKTSYCSLSLLPLSREAWF